MRSRSTRQQVELPSQTSVERELLLYLRGVRRPVEPMSVYGPLADRFGLNALQRHATRRDRDELAWHNRVQFARRRLVDLGYLDGSERGLWGLTPAGRAEADRLASEPEVITLADLLELGL